MKSIKRIALIGTIITVIAALPISVLARPPMLFARLGKGGNCRDELGICHVTARSSMSGEPRNVPVTGQIERNTMLIIFGGKLPAEAGEIPIEEDIALDDATSKLLGFKAVTILHGEYTFSRKGTRFGSVRVKVNTTK